MPSDHSKTQSSTGDQVTPDTGENHQEELARLRAAIEALSGPLPTLLSLHYVDGLTLAEVSTVLGITEQQVSQLKDQALALLGAQAQGSGGE